MNREPRVCYNTINAKCWVLHILNYYRFLTKIRFKVVYIASTIFSFCYVYCCCYYYHYHYCCGISGIIKRECFMTVA
jgi:hypothetical protein